jgi:hypothetical protein
VEDFYNQTIFADPTPPKSGKVHVLKGGGFLADGRNAIPATHARGRPHVRRRCANRARRARAATAVQSGTPRRERTR